MASALGLIKNAKANQKPYYGFDKLARGYYAIVNFRLTKTKYGEAILIELKDEVLFMPHYFRDVLDSDKIEELNNDGVKKFLYFGGRNPTRK